MFFLTDSLKPEPLTLYIEDFNTFEIESRPSNVHSSVTFRATVTSLPDSMHQRIGQPINMRSTQDPTFNHHMYVQRIANEFTLTGAVYKLEGFLDVLS